MSLPQPRRRFVQCLSKSGFHNIALHEYGDVKSPVVLFCVHGLTRNAGDFSFFADYIAKHRGWRTVCVDVVGRGDSDYLVDKSLYNQAQYQSDLTTVLAHVRATMPSKEGSGNIGVPPNKSDHENKLVYIGTSMGGLLGMALASLSSCPFDGMIINDIGPFLPKAAISSIKEYIQHEQLFDTYGQALDYLEQLYGPKFGKHGKGSRSGNENEDSSLSTGITKSDRVRKCELMEHYGEWGIYHDYAIEVKEVKEENTSGDIGPNKEETTRRMAMLTNSKGGKFLGKGKYRLKFDHDGITKSFNTDVTEDVSLWEVYDKIAINNPHLVSRVLTLRGKRSGLLTREIAEEMTKRGPRAHLIEYEDCEHVPPLYHDVDNEQILAWLDSVIKVNTYPN